jgi:hypothetical protein
MYLLSSIAPGRHLPESELLRGGCIPQSGETCASADGIFGEIGIRLPAADDARERAIEITAVVAPGTSTAVTLAMTPLEMAFELNPTARQLYASAFPEHIAVFAADVSTGPSSTARLRMFEDAY